ncbi:hypothetical protein EMIT0194MI4_10252 [Pseudomonas sp. IT-194MI4]
MRLLFDCSITDQHSVSLASDNAIRVRFSGVVKNIMTASRQWGELSLPEAGMPKLVSVSSVNKNSSVDFFMIMAHHLSIDQ